MDHDFLCIWPIGNYTPPPTRILRYRHAIDLDGTDKCMKLHRSLFLPISILFSVLFKVSMRFFNFLSKNCPVKIIQPFFYNVFILSWKVPQKKLEFLRVFQTRTMRCSRTISELIANKIWFPIHKQYRVSVSKRFINASILRKIWIYLKSSEQFTCTMCNVYTHTHTDAQLSWELLSLL